jgi:uncharacterized protein with NRDE domain
VSALSNAALGTPWPKVRKLSAALTAWADRGSDDIDALFDALADRERVPTTLPSTASRSTGSMLSAPFIVATATARATDRSVARDGQVRFVERSFDTRDA